ncbi:MAG: hypothetical protein V2A74_09470 [bacterium]
MQDSSDPKPSPLFIVFFVLLGVLVIGYIGVRNWIEEQRRPRVNRVKADQRSLATGLESYFVDNGEYPAHTFDTMKGANAFAGPVFPSNFSTFLLRTPENQVLSLTTPTAYVYSYFPDPHSTVRGATFGYYRAGETDYAGWILYSAGPDRDYDFEPKYYDPRVSQPSPTLIAGPTYDPTNGLKSDGDVWRVKQ